MDRAEWIALRHLTSHVGDVAYTRRQLTSEYSLVCGSVTHVSGLYV